MGRGGRGIRGRGKRMGEMQGERGGGRGIRGRGKRRGEMQGERIVETGRGRVEGNEGETCRVKGLWRREGGESEVEGNEGERCSGKGLWRRGRGVSCVIVVCLFGVVVVFLTA